MRALFPLGRLTITPGAMDALHQAAGERWHRLGGQLLQRHQAGDWGDLDAHDRAENERALRYGRRLLSAYRLPNDAGRLWIITEADRSATTLLLPEEY